MQQRERLRACLFVGTDHEDSRAGSRAP
jgi:hypothetical protein